MIPVTLVFNWDREQNLSLHIVNEAASSYLVRVNKHVLYTHIQLLYNLPGLQTYITMYVHDPSFDLCVSPRLHSCLDREWF